jgi:hypothetical protein
MYVYTYVMGIQIRQPDIYTFDAIDQSVSRGDEEGTRPPPVSSTESPAGHTARKRPKGRL